MSQDVIKNRLVKLNSDLTNLYKAQPELMDSLNGVIKQASKTGAVSGKNKELMAIAIAIATHCERCILFHLNKALKLGVSRAELEETIAVAIEMGGGPAMVYGAQALSLFDDMK